MATNDHLAIANGKDAYITQGIEILLDTVQNEYVYT